MNIIIGFLKKHYEKLILGVLLLIFIALLIFLAFLVRETNAKKKEGGKTRLQNVYAMVSPSFLPPRIWKCRCLTLWQPSSPQLETTR